VVDTFGGSVRLRHGRDVGTEDLEEWSARAAAVESLPSEQDGSIYYDGLLERVLHRGFNTLTFDLEANEDPEAVKRGLELAAAKRGERDRITVKVAGPEQVSVRLKGGHRLPRVVPRKLGLARWVDAMEEFIFEDTLLDEHLISPDSVSLEEALKQAIAAVKAMELDDFLTVDELGGSVRVRRTRDVPGDANPSDSPTSTEPAWDPPVGDERALLRWFLEAEAVEIRIDFGEAHPEWVKSQQMWLTVAADAEGIRDQLRVHREDDGNLLVISRVGGAAQDS